MMEVKARGMVLITVLTTLSRLDGGKELAQGFYKRRFTDVGHGFTPSPKQSPVQRPLINKRGRCCAFGNFSVLRILLRLLNARYFNHLH